MADKYNWEDLPQFSPAEINLMLDLQEFYENHPNAVLEWLEDRKADGQEATDH
jgi:hypothetical protein